VPPQVLLRLTTFVAIESCEHGGVLLASRAAGCPEIARWESRGGFISFKLA